MIAFHLQVVFKADTNLPDPRYQRAGLDLPAYGDVFLPILAEAWDEDIVTVFATGNRKDNTQGFWSPQRHAKSSNAQINVGVMQSDGRPWQAPNDPNVGNCPPGPIPNFPDVTITGENSVWAFAVNVVAAWTDNTHMHYRDQYGSSLGAAMTAGLVAYWMGLPAPFTVPQGPDGTIARRAKMALIAEARGAPHQSPDAIGHVYNNIVAILRGCSPSNTPKRSVESGINDTVEILWEDIERIYWDKVELEKKMAKLGSDFVVQGPQNKMN